VGASSELGSCCRNSDDLGISALLDLDGKFATASENDLIGFGISKPVAIAGSQVSWAGDSTLGGYPGGGQKACAR
jgi:hypothetical protein